MYKILGSVDILRLRTHATARREYLRQSIADKGVAERRRRSGEISAS
jgi:hypothetical protein